MSTHQCPACRRVCEPLASYCSACGAALDEVDTEPTPLQRHAVTTGQLDSEVSALWLEGPRTVPGARRANTRAAPATPAIPGVDAAASRLPAPAPERPAGSLPAPVPQRPAGSWPAPVAQRPSGRLPPPVAECPPGWRPGVEPDATAALPGVTVLEITLRQPAAASGAAMPDPPAYTTDNGVRLLPPLPPPALPADRAARAAIKIARRAAVRRSRLASAPPPVVSDVLVVDADAAARNGLDDLLRGFGFRVRPVATVAQAQLLAAHHPFAAVFVAVAPGAIDGALHDLFERVREVGQGGGVVATVRVMLAPKWRPMDTVRAELAGCDATLCSPISGRDVARVLDAHGVQLPQDPRRV